MLDFEPVGFCDLRFLTVFFLLTHQILESGSAQSPQEYTASRRQNAWQTFVSGVPSCASLASGNNAFDCLRAASTSDINTGLLYAGSHASEQFPWNPCLDGPNGIFPDIVSRLLNAGKFAKIPFIAGTNLDEGSFTFSTNAADVWTELTKIILSRNCICEHGCPDDSRYQESPC